MRPYDSLHFNDNEGPNFGSWTRLTIGLFFGIAVFVVLLFMGSVMAAAHSLTLRVFAFAGCLSMASLVALASHALLAFGTGSALKGLAQFSRDRGIGWDVVFMLPHSMQNSGWKLEGGTLLARSERRDRRHRDLNTSEYTLYVQICGQSDGSRLRLAHNGFPVQTQWLATWMDDISVPARPRQGYFTVLYTYNGVSTELNISDLLQIVTDHPECIRETKLTAYLRSSDHPQATTHEQLVRDATSGQVFRFIVISGEKRLGDVIHEFIDGTDRLKTSKEGIRLRAELQSLRQSLRERREHEDAQNPHLSERVELRIAKSA